MYRKLFPAFMSIISMCIISCDPVTLSVISIGASAGISQTMNGFVYKTFTLEIDSLHEAILSALRKMDIIVTKSLKNLSRHEIHAVRAGRKIVIKLEPVSLNVTQAQIVVRKNFYSIDSATAMEIVTQTEKILAQ